MQCNCGLVTGKNEPVPLKSIEVEVKVNDHVATVSSTLQYENKEEQPVEAIFVFPLPAEAAVCHFSAKIGEIEVVAHVQEKKKAREEYDDALSSGQQAFLLEESEQSPDVFQLNVGSLPPGESASIRLEYVTELAVQADDGLRICLPAVLNPRYEPRGVNSGGGGHAKVSSVPASAVPYSLSVKAHVASPRPISKVESNCSFDPLNYLNPEQTQATISLAAGHKFDRDVELLVYYKDAHKPTAVVESGQASAEPGSLMGDTVVMLSLYPEFPSSVMSSMTSSGEFIFVVDRSGSMSCPMHRGQGAQERIGSARDTLLLLLKSLPMGCYFNIYGFGSDYESFFPKSVEYNQRTMDDALNKVQTMGADMGGTEILEPLKHIYSQTCIPNQPRQLFLFTDGEVGNTKQVLDLVKKNATSHRCFSFGIGEGASSALITGVAKEGGGHSQFISGTDRMQPKVMQSLRFALQPAVVDISVDWKVPEGVSVTPLSQPISVLFQGQRSLIYAQLTGESSKQTEGSVTVKYSLAKQPVENQLCFSLKPTEDTGLTVHRLGARTLIRSLEVGEREEEREKAEELKNRVVNLSVQSGVSSVFTAFIAVHKGSGDTVKGPMLRRNVPTPMMFGGGPQAMMMCSMPMQRIGACAPPKMRMCNSAPSPFNFAGCIPPPPPPPGCCIPPLPGCAPPQPGCALPMMMCDSPSDFACEEAENSIPVPELPRDPLFQLVSLQKASGSWVLDTALALVLGKSLEEVVKAMPAQVDQEMWATVLALMWLHGFKIQDQDEWQLLAIKAVAWLQAHKVPCVPECVAAGNALLGCQVQKETLRL